MVTTRLLEIVNEGGPRKRRILEHCVKGATSAFRKLLGRGDLVAIGTKRGTVYGTPQQAKKN